MRQILIDAMELKKILPKFILDEAEAYIDETEEIEAIPIMFIEEYIKYQDTEEQKVLRMMWHAWELKEYALDKQIEKWEIDDDVDWEMIQNGEITD